MSHDLIAVVIAAIVALGLTLSSPGFRPAGDLLRIPVGGYEVAIGAPPTVGALVGLILGLLLPGYAFVAAVFPHRPSRADTPPAAPTDRGHELTFVERLALSFGMSVAFLPLVGLAIALTPWEYSAVPVGGALLTLVLMGAWVATLRGHVSPMAATTRRRSALRRVAVGPPDGSSRERAISVVLTLSIVLALGTLAGALVVPNGAEAYTSFSVLAPGEDGPVADGYPASLTQYDAEPFVIAIENHEGTDQRYTVVMQEERVDVESGTVTVLEVAELSRLGMSVRAGETKQRRVDVTPTMAGSDVRIKFYLYRGTAPETAASDTAYRRAFVQVEVVAASGSESNAA